MAVLLSLLLCLLLCGCAQEAPAAQALPPSLTAESPPPPASLYDPGSTLEAAHKGKLKAYPLGDRDIYGIRALGNTLLVFSGSERTTLTALEGEELTPAGSLELDFLLNTRDPSLNFGNRVFSFYDPVRRETLILDDTLEEVRRISAPAKLAGTPVLSQDQGTLFYATSSAVFAWDLEENLHRCLKEISFSGQSVAGVHLDDAVLQLRIAQAGEIRTLFLSTATGRLLAEHEGEVLLQSQGHIYAATLSWGLGKLRIFGEETGSPQLFLPENTESTCFFLEGIRKAVTYTSQSGQLTLEYYDLTTGTRPSLLTLETEEVPIGAAGTPNGIFVLICDPGYGCPTLYRWDVSNAGHTASTQYTAPYSAEPDMEELAKCQEYADSLRKKYGIEILLWQDALRVRPQDCTLVPEYQAGILWRELEELDRRLSQYPESLLKDTISHFSSLRLCILRHITGPAGPAAGLEFLEGSDAYIAVTAGQGAGQGLYYGLFRVMETHILTKSIAFDQWDNLNPQGFAYSCRSTPQPEALRHLEGDDRAFVSQSAMTFPTEDRASVMAAAMMPGSQALFRSGILQGKLKTLCQGIREAYGLGDSTEIFPWEQHLEVSLAKKP